jgi:hypothetical protein
MRRVRLNTEKYLEMCNIFGDLKILCRLVFTAFVIIIIIIVIIIIIIIIIMGRSVVG